MNIEVANRLYQYRKQMGISQEELAEKIGVSRQAVSKWERAEASPDTDNLIELAKVYGLTLDELLQGKAENASAGTSEEPKAADNSYEYKGEYHTADNGDKVHVGWDGIHVIDHNGTKVDIDRKHGVFVSENGAQKVYTDDNGRIHKSDDIKEQEHKGHINPWMTIPYPIIVTIAYILFGSFNVCGGWGYGWIIFLTIPIYYTLIESIQKRDANIFCYPVFAVIAFLIVGFVWGFWHPGWVVFLTIPVYYAIVKSFKHKK